MSDDARKTGDARDDAGEAAPPNASGPGPDASAVDEPEADELIGAVLDDRFRLDELLGIGGMGRVYRARQLSVERDVAVKVLHGELSLQEELRERFFREAKVVSGFKHSNIVRLIDFGQNDEHNLLYLVMELVDGIEIDSLIERGRFRPQLAFQIAYQVCGALIEAHSEGIIHRDLKAENLVLVPVSDGSVEVKVLDFGIALPQEANERLTQTGRIYGTPQYMAPEQAQGKEVDGRTDLFALGAILFEMFVGHLPTGGSSSIEVLLNRVQEGVPRLSEALPDGVLPPEAIELVDSLASQDPDNRPDDAREAREQIRQLRRQQGWAPVTVDLSQDQEEMFEPWLVFDDDLGTPLVGGDVPPEAAQATPSTDGGSNAPPHDRSNEGDDTSREGGTKQGPNAQHATSAPGTDEMSSEPNNTMGRSNNDTEASSHDGKSSGKRATSERTGTNEAASASSSNSSSPEEEASSSGDGEPSPPEASSGTRSDGQDDAPSDGSGTSGGSNTGGGGGDELPQPSGGGDSGGGPSMAVVGCVGAILVGLLAGGGFVFASQAGYLEGTGLSGLLSGSGDGADDESENDAGGYAEDPVCGEVKQADLPSKWTGAYQSKDDSDNVFELDDDTLSFTWPMGRVKDEATLWLAQTSREGRTLSVDCARVVHSDNEAECSGTLSRRGPILTIKLEGADICEDKISGSWATQ